MTNQEVMDLITMHHKPPPATRRAKKRAARHRKACRRELVKLAGHTYLPFVDMVGWAQIRGTVMGWKPHKPVDVPRSLRRQLSNRIGGAHGWRADREALGATWAYVASVAGSAP